MIRTTHARPAALLLATLLVVAACGQTTPPSSAPPTASPAPSVTPSPVATPSPSPSPSQDIDAVYDAIQDQVLGLRGLQPTVVERETIDADALKELATADFDKDNPADYVAANERLYKALGLLEEDASLRSLFLDLIGSQVAGFYRPDAKKLFVVSRTGAVNGADKITFAHEYVHALQDANFDVFKDPEALRDQSDQALARAAVYEGDATLLMTLWALPNLTPAELQEVVAAGSDPESQAILARTPVVLTEPLLFPYNAGLALVQPIQATGGWEGVDAVYGRLPTSTEQVIHPEKYQANEAPVPVALPDDLASRMGSGWSVAFQDTLGEFMTGVWLRDSGVAPIEANAAAAGWGGDRLAVLDGPDGAWAVVIRTTWDDEAEAVEFAQAAQVAIGGLTTPARVAAPGGVGVTIMVGSNDAALLGLDKVFGATGV
ncbi:MAG: hypothetical protein WEC14_07060 [Chloroflexota bacterium]